MSICDMITLSSLNKDSLVEVSTLEQVGIKVEILLSVSTSQSQSITSYFII